MKNKSLASVLLNSILFQTRTFKSGGGLISGKLGVCMIHVSLWGHAGDVTLLLGARGGDVTLPLVGGLYIH